MEVYHQKNSDFLTKRHMKIDEVTAVVKEIMGDSVKFEGNDVVTIEPAGDRVRVQFTLAGTISCSAIAEYDENWTKVVNALADFDNGAVEVYEDGDDCDGGPVTEFIGPPEEVKAAEITLRRNKISDLEEEIAALKRNNVACDSDIE